MEIIHQTLIQAFKLMDKTNIRQGIFIIQHLRAKWVAITEQNQHIWEGMYILV